MAQSSKLFAELLTKALYRIRAETGKKLQVLEDELEYALARGGGSFIPYLRKGHIPAEVADIELLTRELVRRGGLDERRTCAQFLRYAGYPAADRLVAELFPTQAERTQRLPRQSMPPLPPMPGSPITDPSSFFGRAALVRRIFRHYLQPQAMQHVTIIGPRGSGKTSLLHYLQQIATRPTQQLRPDQHDWRPARLPYRWVRIDFHDPRMKRMESLVHHWLAAMEIAAPPQLDLPHFVEALEDHHWQDPVVVLMDEIGAGFEADELDAAFWECLRWLASSDKVQHNLSFVFSAHKPLLALAKERGKVSPLWNIFNAEVLEPLTESEAQALVASFNESLPADDLTWILHQSGRWPKLLHLLCQVRLMAREEGDEREAWQAEALRRLEPFGYLLTGKRQ